MKSGNKREKKPGEKWLAKKAAVKYVLKLYVTGMSAKSLAAVKNITKICERYITEKCDLQVIDICKNPIIAKNGQIIAAPTLVKELPLPLRRFIGDMSDTGKLIVGLDLETEHT